MKPFFNSRFIIRKGIENIKNQVIIKNTSVLARPVTNPKPKIMIAIIRLMPAHKRNAIDNIRHFFIIF